MLNALATVSGVTVVEDAAAPALSLSGERTRRDVISVNAQGKANGYMFRYELSFHVLGSDGTKWLEPATVRATRDYLFDPSRVLARESEEQHLWDTMRRDVVQQIVRRVARATPSPGTTSAPVEP
jgi:LPS-assembly lipoprotein